MFLKTPKLAKKIDTQQKQGGEEIMPHSKKNSFEKKE
jgi:hypothetical protein